MELSIAQVAEAFSRHRFELTYSYLAEDIRWNLVGGEQLAGRGAVTRACEGSAEYLARVTTTFTKFRIVVGDRCVVIDSEATYAEPGENASAIASCDLYDFADGKLIGITSYTIPLGESSDTP
ncbi:MAG TPA: nuclear transport factor 2 family protein [Thermomicrobiales bacterium]